MDAEVVAVLSKVGEILTFKKEQKCHSMLWKMFLLYFQLVLALMWHVRASQRVVI